MLCIYIFETGCHYVAMTNLELKYVEQASLPLTEILLLPLKGWMKSICQHAWPMIILLS